MTRPLIVLTLAALAIAGCGDPSSKFVGSYSGTTDMPKEYTDMLATQGIQANAEGKLANVTLDLNSDGSCKMVTNGGVTWTQEGDWSYDPSNKTITLRITAPSLRKEDIEAMKAKGMTDEMIEKSTKNPMNSLPVEDDSKLVFNIVQNNYSLSITFTKTG